MIKVNFEEPISGEWHEWKKKCHAKTKELVDLVRQNKKWTIDDKLYKKRKDFYYDGFNEKCAYCEKKIEKPYESELDHFRPKKKVTYIDDTIVMIPNENGEKPHPGYYWLIYDWQNLLLSCQLCNKPNNEEDYKLGKRNRFPLEDNRYATTQGEEINEKPLLINPVKEDPQKYFKYNVKDGNLHGKGKGKTCEEIFGLNVRNDLVEGRQTAYEKVFSLFIKLLTQPKNEKKKILDQLKDIKQGKKPHSIAALAAFQEIEPDFKDIFSI